MPAIPEPEPPTIRDRYRAQVRAEVKHAALAQLAQAGPGGISISAIGKQLGVFGPPLPGYDAHAQRLIEAAHNAMNVLLAASTRPPPCAPS